MTHGKPWELDEERQLRQLLDDGKSVDEICGIMVKSRDAVLSKIYSLHLKQAKEDNGKMHRVLASSFNMPNELPSVHDTLMKMAAALSALETPGLDREETLRLRTFIWGIKAYKEIFADYVNYRALEQRLVELEGKYAEAAKKKS